MRTFLTSLGCLLLWAVSAFAQGGLQSDSALKATAGIAASVRVCTAAATGVPCSPLALIYSDSALTVAKTNPFASDANGNYEYYCSPGYLKEQVTVGGTTFTRTVLCAADVANMATTELNQVISPCGLTGADAGVKITQAIAVLPLTGGTVDARCFEGPQTIGATVNVGTGTKPVTLLLGAATFSGAANPMLQIAQQSSVITIPATVIKPTSTNTAVKFDPGTGSVSVFRSYLTGGGTLDGNSLGHRGVIIKDTAEVTVDMVITGWRTAGISMQPTVTTGAVQNTIIRGWIRGNSGAGILLETANLHFDLDVKARVQGNLGGGIMAERVLQGFRAEGDFEGNGSYGTVNTTAGGAVTWVSGTQFNPDWTVSSTTSIKIDGQWYRVASVNSATSITIDTGVTPIALLTGVAYAFGNEVQMHGVAHADLTYYAETNSGSAQYCAIQFDPTISSELSNAIRLQGRHSQNVGGVGSGICLNGKFGSATDVTIGSGRFANLTNGIDATGATDVFIAPQAFSTVTNEVVTNAATRGWRMDGSNLQFLRDNLADIGAAADNRPRTGYFGTSLFAPLFSSTCADPADAGAIRLCNNDIIGWEVSPAGTDATLKLDSNENLLFQGGNDIAWQSGTAFDGNLAHAITADRFWTFPDADGNVPVLPTVATTETGSGAIVRATSPTLVTPVLGVASATSMNLGGATLLDVLSATASLDFTALAANSCEVLTITVSGAADGDAVKLGVPNALADVDGATERTTFFGWVSAADTVSVRRCNVTGTVTAEPAAATVRAVVSKF